MPRYAAYSDSETDFSETDESIVDAPRRQRTAVRRRSMSRNFLSPDYLRPDYRDTYLGPPVPRHTGMHRSASTGRGRRAARDGPAAVVVDIQNDSRNKSTDRSRRLSRNYNAIDISDDDDISIEEIIRSHRRRPRASTSVSRGESPRHRDYELLMDQRILEKNDTRQDMELMRQQQEIERLERELARRRESHRMPRDEEDWYEYEIHDRLRKLDRLERKQRSEEERRSAELRHKIKQYEEEEEREKMRQEIRDEEARKKFEEEEKRKKMAKLKQEAVQEWKLREEAREMEEQKEKEEKDKEFRERLKSEFGYSEEEIEKILARRNERKEDRTLVKREYEKTTWIKVHRRHLLPETLIAYRLAWDWDDRDSNYIIIKQWISEDFQEELFAHTRRLREGKLVTETSNSLTELKVNDRRKDQMYLVRKKSPSRRWMFT